MRALVYRDTDLVLDRDYPIPAPVDGEALIRVLLTGICNTDLEIVRGYMGFQGVLGHEFVGVVEEIYGDVAQERYGHLVGKRVVGEINAACYRPDCWYCQRGVPTHCPHHLKPTESVVILGDGKMGQLAAQVLALVGCEVMMVGKHEEKLALAEKRGVRTYLLDDAERFALGNGRHADLVVECSGSAQGLEMALRLTRARGTLILKSTVSEKSLIYLAPIVIDEIRIQGSRCGPFAPALRALSQKLVDVRPLISACYILDEGLAAFKHAEQKGVLKVLVRV